MPRLLKLFIMLSISFFRSRPVVCEVFASLLSVSRISWDGNTRSLQFGGKSEELIMTAPTRRASPGFDGPFTPFPSGKSLKRLLVGAQTINDYLHLVRYSGCRGFRRCCRFGCCLLRLRSQVEDASFNPKRNVEI